MHPVLRKSADLYAETQRNDTPGKWRTYVDEIMSAIRQTDAKALFEEVCALPADEAREKKHLWIFLHPSYEIFESFVKSDGMEEGFAAFLKVVHGEKAHFLKRLAYRHLPRVLLGLPPDFHLRNARIEHCADKDDARKYIARALDWFVINYGQLLKQHGYSYYYLRREVLELVPTPEIEKKCQEDSIKDIRNKKAVDWFERNTKNLPYHFLRYNQLDRPSEFIQSISEHIRVELDLHSAQWDNLPQHWKNIENVWRILLKSAFEGTWPSVRIAERSELRVFNVDGYCSYDNEKITRVAYSLLEKQDDWFRRLRSVESGRLPIGIKIHGVQDRTMRQYFEYSAFRLESTKGAGSTLIMPPVGNIAILREIFSLIAQKGSSFSPENSKMQIQVCSAGELDPRNAALLGICFYLGSDLVRRYEREDFITTHQYETGGRLVVYGAAGPLDRNYEWWGKDENGALAVSTIPAHITGRTDVLTCKSIRDIDNVNLVATLLVHAQYGGYWEEHGKSFIKEIEGLLAQHNLSGLLAVSWTYHREGRSFPSRDESDQYPADRDGTLFFDMFSELMEYALDECRRILEAEERGDSDARRQGILAHMQEILQRYRTELHMRAKEVHR